MPVVTGMSFIRNIVVFLICSTFIAASSWADSPSWQQITNLLNGRGDFTTNIYYVGPTGTNGASGTLTDPLNTVSNAVYKAGGYGTIVVRGGTYFNAGVNLSNALTLTIEAYPRERPQFWFGDVIAPADFTAVSNGIYSVNLSSALSQRIMFMSNWWRGWAGLTNGIALIQTNVPFGQTPTGLKVPYSVLRSADTNRCEHYPLIWATIANMQTNDGRWNLDAVNNMLYVKFAVSNVVGGLYIASTNDNDSFIINCGTNTDITVKGIESYFGWTGFNFDGAKHWRFERCLAFGNGASGFSNRRNSGAAGSGTQHFAGSGEIIDCEGAAMNGFGFEFTQDPTWDNPSAFVREENCYWHDYQDEASSARKTTRRLVIGSVAYGGGIQRGQFGFIDEGSASIYIGVSAITNEHSGWQLGSTLDQNSYSTMIGCRAVGNQADVSLDNSNDHLVIQGGSFISRTASHISVNSNPTTHTVWIDGASFPVNGNVINPINQVLDGSRYRVGFVNYGQVVLDPASGAITVSTNFTLDSSGNLYGPLQYRNIRTANHTVFDGFSGEFTCNNGASGPMTNTLASIARAGVWFDFSVNTAQVMAIKPNSGQTLVDGGTNLTLIYSSDVGASIRVRCEVTSQWKVIQKYGTWTAVP